MNQGPAAWPADGYLDADGGKTSATASGKLQRHFRRFCNHIEQARRRFLLRLLRRRQFHALLGTARTGPGAREWRPWGAFVSWTGADFDAPALPAGFSVADAASFFARPGPPSAAIVPENTISASAWPTSPT